MKTPLTAKQCLLMGRGPWPSTLIPPLVWALGFPKLSGHIVTVADARDGDFLAHVKTATQGTMEEKLCWALVSLWNQSAFLQNTD